MVIRSDKIINPTTVLSVLLTTIQVAYNIIGYDSGIIVSQTSTKCLDDSWYIYYIYIYPNQIICLEVCSIMTPMIL